MWTLQGPFCWFGLSLSVPRKGNLISYYFAHKCSSIVHSLFVFFLFQHDKNQLCTVRVLTSSSSSIFRMNWITDCEPDQGPRLWRRWRVYTKQIWRDNVQCWPLCAQLNRRKEKLRHRWQKTMKTASPEEWTLLKSWWVSTYIWPCGGLSWRMTLKEKPGSFFPDE